METTRNAVLVRLNIGQYTYKRYDKRLTETFETECDAQQDTARVQKILVAKDAVSEYQRIANDARTYHYKMSLPFADNGDRLLSVANLDKYEETMNEYKDLFTRHVDEFIRNWPLIVSDAMMRLGRFFDPTDYPSDICSKFYMRFSFLPVPEAGHLLIDIGNTRLEQMQANVERATQDAIAAAMTDLWQRIFMSLAKMVERLSKSNNVFRDSLIDNVKDITLLASTSNVTNDPQIQQITERIDRMISLADPDSLRSSTMRRMAVEGEARLILREIEPLAGLNLDAEIRKLELSAKPTKKTTVAPLSDSRNVQLAM